MREIFSVFYRLDFVHTAVISQNKKAVVMMVIRQSFSLCCEPRWTAQERMKRNRQATLGIKLHPSSQSFHISFLLLFFFVFFFFSVDVETDMIVKLHETFLVACTRLYKTLCRSVRPSVRPSVTSIFDCVFCCFEACRNSLLPLPNRTRLR